MAISKKLKKYLDTHQVKYQVMHHPEAYTAQEIAGLQHVPGKDVAKCVAINADGKIILCVVPAIQLLDFKKIKKATNANKVSLVPEEQLSELFPDYEIGAEPPIRELCEGIPLWMDSCWNENKEIVFNAGTHTDMVKMSLSDYLKLSKPDKIVDVGKHI